MHPQLFNWVVQNMFRTIAIVSCLLNATPALAETAAALCDKYASHPWEPGHAGRGVEWGKVLPGPAIRACREALLESPDAPEIQYRLGRTLMQVGSSDEGLALVLRSAQAGYSPAETAYGTAYMQGDGVDYNFTVAYQWLIKASDHGHVIGTNNLATLYNQGLGVRQDPQVAQSLFSKAAEAGYPLAMHNLASTYEHPQAGQPDYDQSFAWYSKAAAAGHLPGITKIGEAYRLGRGVTKDTKKALEWYLKAAEKGEVVGQMQVGLAYDAGRGIERDVAEAERWLRAAAEQGHSTAFLYLGQFLLQNKQGEELQEGIRWLDRAGAYGELEAYIYLAERYALLGDLTPARNYVQVVLNYGDSDIRARAQQILMLIESLELQNGIRRFDNQPFISPGEG